MTEKWWGGDQSHPPAETVGLTRVRQEPRKIWRERENGEGGGGRTAEGDGRKRTRRKKSRRCGRQTLVVSNESSVARGVEVS